MGRPRSGVRTREKVLVAAEVPSALRDQLHASAQAAGLSVSNVIRRGIRAALLVLEPEQPANGERR
jgi:hypothetical protein